MFVSAVVPAGWQRVCVPVSALPASPWRQNADERRGDATSFPGPVANRQAACHSTPQILVEEVTGRGLFTL